MKSRKTTIEDRLTANDRLAILTTVRTLISNGRSQNLACELAGVKVPTFKRWLEQFNTGGVVALEPGKPTGRPPMVQISAEEALNLKRLLVKTNRGKHKGSMTVAARLFAQSAECSDATAYAILKPRSSKHSLPSVVKKAMRVNEAVIDYHRSEHDLRHWLASSTGNLRIKRGIDADGNGTMERLRGGEQQSWDDASINFCVTVPWTLGGDRCSEKFGVKVGRFQLLAGIDDGSGFCPGFSFVIRAQGSYRANDIIGAMARTWMDDVTPGQCILERGTWESAKAERFYRLTGTPVRHVHTSNDKLVENFWSRLWTQLSIHDGQIGRYRGEMERENKILTACQQGHQNPASVFPSLANALNAFEMGLTYLNADPIESRKYGTWIPQDRYRDDLAAQPRPALSRDNAWMLAPEQRTWTVRKNGTTGGMVPCVLGPSIPYYFACDRLWDYVGAKVTVYFDPYLNPMPVAIVLAAPFRGEPAETVISTNAQCLTDAPMLTRLVDSYTIAAPDGVPFEQALKYRQAYFQAVRTEYRSLGYGGRRKNQVTQLDNGVDQRQVIEISSQPEPLAIPDRLSPPPRRYRRPGAATPRLVSEEPATGSRITFDDVEQTELVQRNKKRLEEARARGAVSMI